MNSEWPLGDAGGTLGDGKFATATHHPATVDELAAVVREAEASGLAVYPQGGGTALDFGGIPARPGVAIRTGRLDRVVDYPAADMTITLEAGMTLGAVRAIVAGAGQRLAIEAAHPDRATLGGIFASAATGPRRFGWGRPRDAIIGVGFINGVGELIRGGGRVVKNVAGYDLPKLLTGSMGTLGIITELTLKVNPRPAAAALVQAEYDALEAVAAVLADLNVSGTRPVALELVDGRTLGRDEGGWTLLVGLEGNQAAVDWQVERLTTELKRPTTVSAGDAAVEAAWLDFVATEAAEPGSITFQASFAPSVALRFLDRVDPQRWAIRVHAGNGVVRGAARQAGVDREGWASEIAALRRGADRLGGALILPRCPTAWKDSMEVWGPPRADWAIAERVKHALDPGLVLNPGRYVGSI